MELFIDLGLKEIASIINIMGKSENIDKLNGEVYSDDGTKYSYEKNGNEFRIFSDNGKETKIKINCERVPWENLYGKEYIRSKHEVFISYKLDNGNSIDLYNDISLHNEYTGFEDVTRHDLMYALSCKYCSYGDEEASFSLGLDRLCFKNNGKTDDSYEFTENGIKNGNKIITVDGDKLVSLKGSDVPSLDVLKSFDLEKEKEKLEKILNDSNDLHPFTIEAVGDALRKLDCKKRYAEDIINYYDADMRKVKKAISLRNNIMDSVKSKVIDKDVLDLVCNDYYKKTSNDVVRRVKKQN